MFNGSEDRLAKIMMGYSMASYRSIVSRLINMELEVVFDVLGTVITFKLELFKCLW